MLVSICQLQSQLTTTESELAAATIKQETREAQLEAEHSGKVTGSSWFAFGRTLFLGCSLDFVLLHLFNWYEVKMGSDDVLHINVIQ